MNSQKVTFLSFLGGLCVALSPSLLMASTIDVDSGPGGCTLVDAIKSANDNMATGSCIAGEAAPVVDVIQLPMGVTINMSAVEHSGFSDMGLPEVVEDLMIQGNGATLDGQGVLGFLAVEGAALTVNELSMVNGGSSVAVFAFQAAVTLNKVVIQDSSGAVVSLTSDLTIRDSSLINNGAYDYGVIEQLGNSANSLILERVQMSNDLSNYAGVNSSTYTKIDRSRIQGFGNFALSSSNVMEVLNSTIDHNGFGISSSGDILIVNTTISDIPNQALALSGTGAVRNTTIANTVHPFSGDSGVITASHVIISNNVTGCTAPFHSLGHNLQFDTGAPGGCGFVLASDVDEQDPGLLPLADNGGPTPTREITAAAAINAGAASCGVTQDQRGAPRPAGSNCDIGAYETGDAHIAVDPVSYDFGPVTVGDESSTIVMVKNAGNEATQVEALLQGDVAHFAIVNYLPGDFPITLKAQESVDVEVKFTPMSAGALSSDIVVNAASGVPLTTYVSLTGLGVAVSVPVDEQIVAILALCESCIADNELMGDGPGKSAKGRLKAWKNKLESVGSFIELGDYVSACDQLDSVVERSDGLDSPPDFVKGACVPDLNEALMQLRTDLGC